MNGGVADGMPRSAAHAVREARVDTLDDALRIVGKARHAKVFQALADAVRQRQPAPMPGCSVSRCARWR